MIVMKIDGVDGSCEVPGHDKWIQCNTVNWKTLRQIATKTGRTADRTVSVVQCEDVSITKEMDSSSAKLFELSCGSTAKEVKIHFIYGTGKDAASYCEWTLEEALVSKYEISADDEGKGVETLNLNFNAIEIKSIPRSGDDSLSGPYPAKFSKASGTTTS